MFESFRIVSGVTPTSFTAPRLQPWPSDIPIGVRLAAAIEASAELCWLDLCRLLGYRVLRTVVSRVRTRPAACRYDALTLVRVAVRDACVFYVKPVHCLQRSAAVTRMLRRRGIAAELVIGCQPMPVESHAWVEVDGTVVWDRLPTLPHYRVIDRM